MFPLGDDNPTHRTPIINWMLIIANIFVFILEIRGGDDFIFRWSFIPLRLSRFLQGEFDPDVWLTVFSAMFMHAGIGHIAGNLLFLWIFGDNVEDMFGHFSYLVFYLICGIGGTFFQYLTNPFSQVPNLGASGAISGVLAAYMIMFPRARVRLAIWPLVLLIGTIPVPALVLIGIWFFMQLSSGVQLLGMMTDVGGVAYWAHIGGFVVGFVLVWFLRPRRRQPTPRYDLRY